MLPSHRGEVRTTDDNRAGLTILGTKLVGNRVTALIIGVIIVVAAALCVGTLGPWKSAQGPGDAKWNGYAVKDLVGESFER